MKIKFRSKSDQVTGYLCLGLLLLFGAVFAYRAATYERKIFFEGAHNDATKLTHLVGKVSNPENAELLFSHIQAREVNPVSKALNSRLGSLWGEATLVSSSSAYLCEVEVSVLRETEETLFLSITATRSPKRLPEKIEKNFRAAMGTDPTICLEIPINGWKCVFQGNLSPEALQIVKEWKNQGFNRFEARFETTGIQLVPATSFPPDDEKAFKELEDLAPTLQPDGPEAAKTRSTERDFDEPHFRKIDREAACIHKCLRPHFAGAEILVISVLRLSSPYPYKFLSYFSFIFLREPKH